MHIGTNRQLEAVLNVKCPASVLHQESSVAYINALIQANT